MKRKITNRKSKKRIVPRKHVSLLFVVFSLTTILALIFLVQQKQNLQQHAATSSLLTWAPPTCGDSTHGCVDLTLTNTGANQSPSLSIANDYRIHLPNVPLQGGLQIHGGHNVIIIGGEIDLTVPCSDSSSACHGINISRSNAGQVFIEGVWIHNPTTIPSSCATSGMPCSTGDGVDLDAAPGPVDVTMENVRIDGISGCSGGSDHADVFQPYNAGNAKLHIDHLTGTTNCQGMMIDPDYALTTYGTMPTEGIFENMNMNVLPNPYSGNNNRYMWWFTYYPSAGPTCTTYPITLQNAYAQEPNNSLLLNSVWPDSNANYGCPASYQSGIASWPNIAKIVGSITNGLPPAGDFVPVGTAGINYVSPGYIGSTTPTTAPTITPTPSPTTVPPTNTPTPVIPTPTVTLDTTPPSVTVTAPKNNTTVTTGATITLSATASDNVGVNHVNFLVNGTLLCSDNTAPYSCSWIIPGTSNVIYTITAQAYDAAGNASSNSVQVTATKKKRISVSG